MEKSLLLSAVLGLSLAGAAVAADAPAAGSAPSAPAVAQGGAAPTDKAAAPKKEGKGGKKGGKKGNKKAKGEAPAPEAAKGKM